MSWYLVIKFFHIAAVIISVGGLFARQLIRQHAASLDDVHAFAAFTQAATRIERAMVIPGMSAVLVFGVILGFLGHYPILGFIQGGQQNWLLVSNILLIGILVVIQTVFIPRSRRLKPILEDAVARGKLTPELRGAISDRTVVLAHRYEELAIILIAALMVLKPF